MKKTWFITGASRGFGRIWAEAALQRGDRVTATARKLADVTDLAERFGDTVLPLALDVTDSAQVEQAVHQAYAHFGRFKFVVSDHDDDLGFLRRGSIRQTEICGERKAAARKILALD